MSCPGKVAMTIQQARRALRFQRRIGKRRRIYYCRECRAHHLASS